MPEHAGAVALTAASFDDVVPAAPAPYVVEFGAEWCAPCTSYGPLVAEVVAERGGRIRLGTVDIGAEPELAERFGIRTVPALVIFRDGVPAKRIFGVRPRRYLADQLDVAIAAAGTDRPR